MQYVYVKDSEGYVSKKLISKVCKGEKIISGKAYLKASGLAYYEKEEKDFISYARERGLILANLMKA